MRTVSSEIVSALGQPERIPCARITVRDILPRFTDEISDMETYDKALSTSGPPGLDHFVRDYDQVYITIGAVSSFLRSCVMCYYEEGYTHHAFISWNEGPWTEVFPQNLVEPFATCIYENRVFFSEAPGSASSIRNTTIRGYDFNGTNLSGQAFRSGHYAWSGDGTYPYPMGKISAVSKTQVYGIESQIGELNYIGINYFAKGVALGYGVETLTNIVETNPRTGFDAIRYDGYTYIYFVDPFTNISYKMRSTGYTDFSFPETIFPNDPVDTIEYYNFHKANLINGEPVITGQITREDLSDYYHGFTTYHKGNWHLTKGREMIVGNIANSDDDWVSECGELGCFNHWGHLIEVGEYLYYRGWGWCWRSDNTYLFGYDNPNRKVVTEKINNIKISYGKNSPDTVSMSIVWDESYEGIIEKGSVITLEMGYYYSGTAYYAAVGNFVIDACTDAMSSNGRTRSIVARSENMWRLTTWHPDTCYEWRTDVSVQSNDPTDILSFDKCVWYCGFYYNDEDPYVYYKNTTKYGMLKARLPDSEKWELSADFLRGDGSATWWWGLFAGFVSPHPSKMTYYRLLVNSSSYKLQLFVDSVKKEESTGSHGLDLSVEHNISMDFNKNRVSFTISSSGDEYSNTKYFSNWNLHPRGGVGGGGVIIDNSVSTASSFESISSNSYIALDNVDDFSSGDIVDLSSSNGLLLNSNVEIGSVIDYDDDIPSDLLNMVVADGIYYGGSQPWANSAQFTNPNNPVYGCSWIWLEGPGSDYYDKDEFNDLFLDFGNALFRIDGYDYSAPQSKDGESWVNNRRRFFVTPLSGSYEPKVGDTCSVSVGLELASIIDSCNSSGNVTNSTTDSYGFVGVRVGDVHATSYAHNDIQLSDIIFYICKLSGISEIEATSDFDTLIKANYILDMDRSGLSNINDILADRKFYFYETGDGKLYITRGSSDILYSSSAPYNVYSSLLTLSNENLITRARIVGIEELESMDIALVKKYGNYYKYLSAPNLDSESELETELQDILDESKYSTLVFEFSGPYDPRLVKTDMMWVRLQARDEIGIYKVRIADFNVDYSVRKDGATADMFITTGEVIEKYGEDIWP